MKKLFFLTLILCSSSIYCAHESSKKKKVPYREDKFASNTVEFIDFFKLVQARANKAIMEGHANLSCINPFTPNPRVSLMASRGKDTVFFPDDVNEAIIDINGDLNQLPQYLQAIPENTRKTFTIKLRKYILVESSFTKSEKDFNAHVVIKDETLKDTKKGKCTPVTIGMGEFGEGGKITPPTPQERTNLTYVLDAYFNPMIREATKKAPFSEMKKATGLTDRSADLVRQFMFGQTQANIKAERAEDAERAAIFSKKPARPAPTPPTASTSALPTGGRSLEEEE